jgi:hypothetical protein
MIGIGSIVALLGLLSCAAADAQNTFTLTGIIPESGQFTALDVNYAGTYPDNPSAYLDKAAWRVWVKPNDELKPHELEVTSVERIVSTAFMVNKIRLRLSGDLPAGREVITSDWHALFNPSRESGLLGLSFDSTPNAAPQVFENSRAHSASSSCENAPPAPRPYFCAPSAGTPADVSLSGSFLAGGGSKPIYSFELRGALYGRNPVQALAGFHPGVATLVEINQAVQPPSNRTTFDPDSIQAALALQRLKAFRSPKFGLYGLQFDEYLPSGEFSRTDPSSNIIFRSSMLLGFSSFSSAKYPSLYRTIYPVTAIEAGENLNKPTSIASVPVDLRRYNSIFRGVLGADALIAIASDDRSSDVFSLGGSYRLRLPAFDEPSVEMRHQLTTVALTSKPRNWIQANANFAPWRFKYLSLNARYEYGALPPLFPLVNHQFTIGFTLQAVQTGKPGLVSAPQ